MFYIEFVEAVIIMDRTSHHKHKSDNLSRREKSHSSSSSDANMQKIKQLEALVAEIRKDSQATSQTSQQSLPLRRTYPGDEAIIPIFDPIKTTMTVEEWVKRIDDLAVLYDWDDRSIFQLIISRLEGHAKEWFHFEEKNMTWAETKIALIYVTFKNQYHSQRYYGKP